MVKCHHMGVNNNWIGSYEEFLFEQLQEPERAIGYLFAPAATCRNEALADPDPRVFRLALQDVLKARSLPEPVGEDMASVKAVLDQLGYTLRVSAVLEMTA